MSHVNLTKCNCANRARALSDPESRAAHTTPFARARRRSFQQSPDQMIIDSAGVRPNVCAHPLAGPRLYMIVPWWARSGARVLTLALPNLECITKMTTFVRRGNCVAHGHAVETRLAYQQLETANRLKEEFWRRLSHELRLR